MLYFYIIGLIALLLASIYDIKTREIPDILSYSFFAIILISRILFSFKFGFGFLFEGILGMFALGIFSLIMFFSGQWGGGDVKLMFGLGCLLGFTFTLFNPIVIFLLCIIFTGAVYGLIYLTTSAIMHFSDFKKEFKQKFKLKPLLLLILLAVFAIIALIYFKDPLFISGLMIISVLPLLFLLLIAVKSIEVVAFRKVIAIARLTEGDWLANDIIKNKKVVVKARNVGLLKKDIQKLKQIKIKQVKIRTGMPFVPVFLLAFILFLIIKYAGIIPII